MTTFKKIFAAATAAATVGVLSLASIPASAADITYNGPSDGALVANDDGATVRMNIFNEWITNKIMDIEKSQTVIDYIEVEFTITGLNGRYCNMNEDGSEADAYEVSLCGNIGTDIFWGNPDKPDEDTTTPGKVSINGDGTYTVRTNLTQPADTVLCLLLSSNINFYQLGENVTGIADSGVNVTIDAIRTGDESTGGGEGEGGEGSTTTTTTGAGGGGTTTTTTTKKANSGSSSNNSNKSNNNSTSNSTTSTVSQTADAGVVAIVVGAAAAASLAAGAMTIKRKRK